MAEQWIDWHPKVGDIKPAGYRYWSRISGCWVIGAEQGFSVNSWEAENAQYQIPASVVTPPEDRPPWIDPQCKFRWGDRVKDKRGDVWFVNHPHDGDGMFPVICTRTLHYAAPYTAGDVACWYQDDNIDVFNEGDLELFPEELPQHFDDRLLDADQPQEQPKTARVPREIWVTVLADASVNVSWGRKPNPPFSEDTSTTYHFREVLPSTGWASNGPINPETMD